jgi:hypothetical protein
MTLFVLYYPYWINGCSVIALEHFLDGSSIIVDQLELYILSIEHVGHGYRLFEIWACLLCDLAT